MGNITSNDITMMENDNKATLAVKSPVESFQPNKIQDQPCTSRNAQKLNFQASRGTSLTTQLIISVNSHHLRPIMHLKLLCLSLR